MVCLGAYGAVVCLWDGRSIRVQYVPHIPVSNITPDFRSFPLPNTVFPRASNKYTQSARFALIVKLSACDDVFGALSSDGELFIFTPPEGKPTSGGEKVTVKPQLVWALRKAFTAVKVGWIFLGRNRCLHPIVGFLNGGWWVYYSLHGLRSRLPANEKP